MTAEGDKSNADENVVEAAEVATDEKPTEADRLANDMLEQAVHWLNDANDHISQWENVRREAKRAGTGASGDDDDDGDDDGDDGDDERKLLRYKAGVWSHMASVGLGAGRQIQQAAAEELTNIQEKFFVKGIDVEPNKDTKKATASVERKRSIPAGYRFWWKVTGDPEVTPIDKDQYTSVEITSTSKLPVDTTVEVLVGKVIKHGNGKGKEKEKENVDPWRNI
jgi:hypothetical protein